jgi:energy-converting hydrogenase Eha subunit E
MFLTKLLTIEHSGVESTPPLRLYVAERSATAQAIARLKDGPTDAPVPVATRTASGPTRPDRMRSILRVQSIAVGVALIVIGAFWVTPQLGAVGLAWVGLAWTALAAIVTAANLRSWLVAARRLR